jgi:hypothetical protein
MKKVLGLALIIALGVTACAQQKKTTTKSSTKATKATTGKMEATGANDKMITGAISYISMSRGACFGTCPVYTIELSKDGAVTYTGKRNTKYAGTYVSNIGASKVAAIFKEFETYRVDTCQDTYKMMVADLPGITYEIKMGSKTKKIRNANFGPAFLTSFAEDIDKAVTVDDTWKKTAEPKKD